LLRSLSANFYKHFGTTSDFNDVTRNLISYSFTLLTARNFVSLDTTRLVHQQLRLRAARLQTYMDNGLDQIDFSFIGGYGNKRLHDKNYCQVFNFLAKTLISPEFVYPFSLEELELVHHYAGDGRQKSKNDPELFQYANQAWLLTMMGLAVAKNEEGRLATDPGIKERSLSSSCKYANEFLGWVIELRNRKDTSLNKVSPAEIELLLNMLENDKTDTPSYFDKWLCFMNFKKYNAAWKVFGPAAKDFSFWSYKQELIAEMAIGLNNTDEVVEEIKKGHSDYSPTDKAIVFLFLNRPEAALGFIQTWDHPKLTYFCDESDGLKVLRMAKTKNQQKILEFFYQEIVNTLPNLDKVPKKNYNNDLYEQMVKLSSITEELGNNELSHKLYNYYTKMYQNR
jgi:hypothetical protein